MHVQVLSPLHDNVTSSPRGLNGAMCWTCEVTDRPIIYFHMSTTWGKPSSLEGTFIVFLQHPLAWLRSPRLNNLLIVNFVDRPPIIDQEITRSPAWHKLIEHMVYERSIMSKLSAYT